MHGFFVFLALALLGTMGGFLLWQDYVLFRRTRVRTTGTVVGHRAFEDGGSKYYSGQIAFEDQSGKRHEFTDTYGRAKPTPEVGAKIEVMYPRGEPQHARVPRPILRMLIYLFIAGAAATLVARELGFIGG